MSKPRLSKEPREKPSSKPHHSVITEADLAIMQQARTLRDQLQVIYKTPCPSCGAKPTIPGLAETIGVTQALLWRFINGKQATVMQENFEKIARFVATREKGA